FFFFVQAEDGIRDLTVTGVQTCALPISENFVPFVSTGIPQRQLTGLTGFTGLNSPRSRQNPVNPVNPVEKGSTSPRHPLSNSFEIGRASCRERVYMSMVVIASQKKLSKF